MHATVSSFHGSLVSVTEVTRPLSPYRAPSSPCRFRGPSPQHHRTASRTKSTWQIPGIRQQSLTCSGFDRAATTPAFLAGKSNRVLRHLPAGVPEPAHRRCSARCSSNSAQPKTGPQRTRTVPAASRNTIRRRLVRSVGIVCHQASRGTRRTEQIPGDLSHGSPGQRNRAGGVRPAAGYTLRHRGRGQQRRLGDQTTRPAT